MRLPLDPARQRALASLRVLAALVASLLLLLTPLYRLGGRLEDDRVFLKNYRSPNEYETEIHIKMDYALGSREDNGVILLGESGCYFGVSPALLGELSGLRSYNLGMPGVLGVRPLRLTLRSYLENHPRPRAAVVCCSPNHLDGSQLDQGLYERFLWCYGRGGEETRPTHKDVVRDYASSGGRYLLGEITGGLGPRLDETIQGFSHPDATYNKIAKDREAGRGFHQLGDLSWKHDAFQGYRDPPFTVSPENQAGFQELAGFCADNGIALVVRFSPYAEEDAPEDWPSLQAWADEFRNTPGVTLAPPVVLLYPKEWMADTRHCNAAGVKRLTALVADEVKTALKNRPGRPLHE